MVDEMAMKNVVKPANREANYFMKYGKFKNFDDYKFIQLSNDEPINENELKLYRIVFLEDL